MPNDILVPDSEDFASTAVPFLNDLYRTAVRMLRNCEAAEDCVQETYLQAQRSFHRFQKGTNCRAWMFTILFHVVHHYRRKWFRFRGPGEDGLRDAPAPRPAVTQLTDQEMLRALMRSPPSSAKWCCCAMWRNSRIRRFTKFSRFPLAR